MICLLLYKELPDNNTIRTTGKRLPAVYSIQPDAHSFVPDPDPRIIAYNDFDVNFQYLFYLIRTRTWWFSDAIFIRLIIQCDNPFVNLPSSYNAPPQLSLLSAPSVQQKLSPHQLYTYLHHRLFYHRFCFPKDPGFRPSDPVVPSPYWPKKYTFNFLFYICWSLCIIIFIK